MKANEAPEKIYLVPFGKPIREPLPQEGSDADTIWSSRPYANSNAGNIEYTRTDAFIEEACVKLKKLMYDNLMFQGRLHRGEIIETFVGNFKNYMKGE